MGFGPFRIEHPEIVLASLIGLVLLVFLFFKLNFPGSVPYFKELLGHRASRIEETHTQVERALADAKQLRDEYASRLARIEVEARERIEAAVKEADSARAEIIAEAAVTAEAVRRRSEEEIARESRRHRIAMRREIVQITLDAAEQSVRANSGETVQRQLIKDFIALAGTSASGKATSAATATLAAPPTQPNPTTPPDVTFPAEEA